MKREMKLRRWLVALPLAIGLAGAGLLLLTRQGRSTGEQGRHTDEAPVLQTGFEIPREHGPFLFGTEVTLREAEEAFPLHLFRPDTPVANDSLIRAVYLENVVSDTGEPFVRVAIGYESGILMYIDPVDLDPFLAKNPAAGFRVMAADASSDKGASVRTVHGVPALVVERDADQPAVVDLVLGKVRAQLFGKYAPLEASLLTEAAESLK